MSDKSGCAQKNIINVYALFVVAVVLSIVPQIWAALVSLLFFTLLLGIAYFLRRRCEEHSLQHNHMIYIIRTVWIATFITLLGVIAAMVYIVVSVDPLPFQSCADPISNQVVRYFEAGQTEALYALLEPCLSVFFSANSFVFILSGLIVGGPVLMYLAYRLTKGMRRALKGYRLANPKEWF